MMGSKVSLSLYLHDLQNVKERHDTMFDDTVCTPFPHNPEYLLWLTFISESKQTWYVVSDTLRREYILFKGKKQTRYKSENPLDLYPKMK
jgi:hypothetical protein